jgi:hypothetical protein
LTTGPTLKAPGARCSRMWGVPSDRCAASSPLAKDSKSHPLALDGAPPSERQIAIFHSHSFLRANTCAGPNKRARRDGLQCRCTSCFKYARQMFAHRTRDGSSSGESKRQQHHSAVDRNVRVDSRDRLCLRAIDLRKKVEVQRKANDNVGRSPSEAGITPSNGFPIPMQSKASLRCLQNLQVG